MLLIENACCLFGSSDRSRSRGGSHIRIDCRNILKGQWKLLLKPVRITTNTWKCASICFASLNRTRTWPALAAKWLEILWNAPRGQKTYKRYISWFCKAEDGLFPFISSPKRSCCRGKPRQNRSTKMQRPKTWWCPRNCLESRGKSGRD